MEKSSQLKNRFNHFRLEKIDCQQNKEANQLSRIASGDVPDNLSIEVELRSVAIIDETSLIMVVNTSEKTWVDEIEDFIEKDILPEDPKEAKRIRRQSARHIIHEGVLYRRSFTKPLLR